jgi:hypothetical protein
MRFLPTILLWLLATPISTSSPSTVSFGIHASGVNSTRRLVGELLFVGDVGTLAGAAEVSASTDGIGTYAQFNVPHGLAISQDRVYALVADTGNHVVRRIIISTASVTTWAGGIGTNGATNGIGTNSRFDSLRGVAISPDGLYVLVSDEKNHLIRKIVISTVEVTTFAGVAGSIGAINGIGTDSKFYYPKGVSISSDGVFALVAESSNHLIRQIVLSTASVTTLAGAVGSNGATNGIGTNSQFNYPYGVSISPNREYALVTDVSNHLIRKVVISTGSVTTFAGVPLSSGFVNGIGTNSQFHSAYGLAISPDGVYALVTDFANQLIRQIIISTVSVTTLAGVTGSIGAINGIGTNAKFKYPYGVAISSDGAYALITEESNSLIRQIIMNLISPSTAPSLAPTTDPSVVPSVVPSISPSTAPSLAPTTDPSVVPSVVPSISPSSLPTVLPSQLPAALVRYNFGVIFGDDAILSAGNALLVDHLRDLKRGERRMRDILSYSFTLFSFRQNLSHLENRQLLSGLFSYRSSLVCGISADQMAASHRRWFLGRPCCYSWRPIAVLARESFKRRHHGIHCGRYSLHLFRPHCHPSLFSL